MINIESFRDYCLKKRGVTEHFPFDETTLVFKVMNKMFALTDIEGEFSINLKCNPERSIELREEYSQITPGYHMNKVHWNTVLVDDYLSEKLILELIDHSYDLIVNSLPKKKQIELENLV